METLKKMCLDTIICVVSGHESIDYLDLPKLLINVLKQHYKDLNFVNYYNFHNYELKPNLKRDIIYEIYDVLVLMTLKNTSVSLRQRAFFHYVIKYDKDISDLFDKEFRFSNTEHYLCNHFFLATHKKSYIALHVKMCLKCFKKNYSENEYCSHLICRSYEYHSLLYILTNKDFWCESCQEGFLGRLTLKCLTRRDALERIYS